MSGYGYGRTRKWEPRGTKGTISAYMKAKSARRTKQQQTRSSAVVPGWTRSTGSWGRFSGRNSEWKYFDLIQNPIALASPAGLGWNLNCDLPAGTGASERVGRKVTLKSVNLKLGMLMGDSTSSLDSTEVYRVILCVDRQANGNSALITDVLEAPSTYQSFANMNNCERFKILRDKTYTINRGTAATPIASYTELPGAAATPNGGGFTAPASTLFWAEARKDVEMYIPLEMDVEYSGATGAIGEVRSNNLRMFIIPQHSGGTTLVTWSSRIRYSD